MCNWPRSEGVVVNLTLINREVQQSRNKFTKETFIKSSSLNTFDLQHSGIIEISYLFLKIASHWLVVDLLEVYSWISIATFVQVIFMGSIQTYSDFSNTEVRTVYFQSSDVIVIFWIRVFFYKIFLQYFYSKPFLLLFSSYLFVVFEPCTIRTQTRGFLFLYFYLFNI